MVEFNCNFTCASGGGASISSGNNLKKALPTEILAPWVKMVFQNSGDEVTVGNMSDPKNGNRSIITSFQYGFSGAGKGNGAAGINIKCEILDEEGGSFDSFVRKSMNKSNDKDKLAQLTAKFTFGWILQSCGQSARAIKTEGETNAVIKFVDVVYQDGRLKFNMSGNGGGEDIHGANSDRDVEGDDRNRLPLKDAIREIYQKYNMQVDFLTKSEPSDYCGRKNCSDSVPCWEWKFKASAGGSDPCKGPEAAWRPDNQDVHSAVLSWLSGYTTVDDNSFSIMIDSQSSTSKVIIWEEPKVNCDGSNANDPSHTYIINGGACSPVISFSPKLQWPANQLLVQGGNSGTNTGAAPVDSDSVGPVCDLSGSGSPTSTPSHYVVDETQLEDAGRETEKSQQAMMYAHFKHTGIEATLVVQGDPTYGFSTQAIGKIITLIVINPFYIEKGLGDCGSWIARPACNQVMTNRQWKIIGVDHQITQGKFITTLDLILPTPGITIDRSAPLGGVGSGGPTVQNT